MSYRIFTDEELPQGSDEWKAFRRGKISSTKSKIIGASRGPAVKNMIDKLSEELSPTYTENFVQTAAIKHGNQYEPEAAEYYAKELLPNQNTTTTALALQHVGIIQNDKWEGLAILSPDGLVTDLEGKILGALEIKCRDVKQWQKFKDTKTIKAEAMHQLRHYFTVIDDLQWIDYMEYNPFAPTYEERAVVVRVYRNDEIKKLAKLESKIDEVYQHMYAPLETVDESITPSEVVEEVASVEEVVEVATEATPSWGDVADSNAPVEVSTIVSVDTAVAGEDVIIPSDVLITISETTIPSDVLITISETTTPLSIITSLPVKIAKVEEDIAKQLGLCTNIPAITKENYSTWQDKLGDLKKLSSSVEKSRKQLKQPITALNKSIETKFKDMLGSIVPTSDAIKLASSEYEAELQKEADRIQQEADAALNAMITARTTELSKYAYPMEIEILNLAEMQEAEYQKTLAMYCNRYLTLGINPNAAPVPTPPLQRTQEEVYQMIAGEPVIEPISNAMAEGTLDASSQAHIVHASYVMENRVADITPGEASKLLVFYHTLMNTRLQGVAQSETSKEIMINTDNFIEYIKTTCGF